MVIPDGKNVEYGYFGDLNGDGNLDAVYANGDKADVNIIWGLDKSQVKDPTKWVDAGPIPSSKNQGHYVYLETFDINQDGALDIVVANPDWDRPITKTCCFGNKIPGYIPGSLRTRGKSMSFSKTNSFLQNPRWELAI